MARSRILQKMREVITSCGDFSSKQREKVSRASQDQEYGDSGLRGSTGDPETPTRRMWGYLQRAERAWGQGVSIGSARFSFTARKEVDDAGSLLTEYWKVQGAG